MVAARTVTTRPIPLAFGTAIPAMMPAALAEGLASARSYRDMPRCAAVRPPPASPILKYKNGGGAYHDLECELFYSSKILIPLSLNPLLIWGTCARSVAEC